MKNYNIYGLGAALVDMEVEVDDNFLNEHKIEKGMMTLVEPNVQASIIAALEDSATRTKKASGGSAANTIMAANHFGASTFYSCKAAQDSNGDFFVNDFEKAGVDCNLNADNKPEGTTGSCLVMITPDAERTMNTYLGISESLSAEQLNAEAIANSEYYYMEGYLCTSDTGRNAAIEGRKIAEANQVKTAITLSDPAMVQFFKDALAEMIGSGVDLLFCNEEEALSWSGSENFEDAFEALKQVSKAFAITRGAQGASLFDGQNRIDVAGNTVKAIDTNGAGDMFAGAFMFGITQGYDFEKAGRLASLASAQVVSQFGPRLLAEDHPALIAKI